MSARATIDKLGWAPVWLASETLVLLRDKRDLAAAQRAYADLRDCTGPHAQATLQALRFALSSQELFLLVP